MTVDDRVAIADLLARYADAVDRRDLDALDAVFTADATIDFSAFGGSTGDLAATKQFLAESLGIFRRTQHMMGLPLVTVDGDRATARTTCHNPMLIDNADGTTSVWLIGLWYDDDLVRTADGWRISHRRQERCYFVTGLTDAPTGAS
jgi:ketosteroid isomerase-like protein